MSVFAGLRRRHPDLVPQDLSKATLLALTRAIEDEFCARGEPAALYAGFQQERFYRQSRPRWKELTRTARVVVVFSDFRESSGSGASPLTVRIPADAPLRREWFLVCAAADYSAFVSGWEFPGQAGTPDARRRFEVLWSVDPPAVQDAAPICAQLAAVLSPGLAKRPVTKRADGPRDAHTSTVGTAAPQRRCGSHVVRCACCGNDVVKQP